MVPPANAVGFPHKSLQLVHAGLKNPFDFQQLEAIMASINIRQISVDCDIEELQPATKLTDTQSAKGPAAVAGHAARSNVPQSVRGG